MDGQGIISDVFAFLDTEGTALQAAEVELRLGNDEYMTVQCGGPGERSRPALGLYEVLVDHPAPRFWQRFSDQDELVYGLVPQLLVRHHITRRGGIVERHDRVVTPRSTISMDLQIEVELGLEMQIMEAIRAQGANVKKSRLIRH